MNPLDVAARLRNRYLSYLTTTFGLSDALAEMARRFEEALTHEGRLVVGPFLEATAPYKKSDSTLRKLIEPENVLHPGWQAILGEAFPKDDPRERWRGDMVLYLHQLEALRRLCQYQQDIAIPGHTVVASGTGSGKTECFLIPTIDWILRHPTRNSQGQTTTGQGIRALLVYPMNALVNDQIRRLQQVVGCWKSRKDPFIPVTFARYTSETEDAPNWARSKEPEAPDNQLLSRQEILSHPPDILITNFAMLEQALMRPKETPLFTVLDEHAWRFLILDEAHSYRGAQAIELSRLMQRLRAAIRRGKCQAQLPVNEPVCIATSASLVSHTDAQNNPRKLTADFASKLFGLTVSEQGVVFAQREDPTGHGDQWLFVHQQAALNATAAGQASVENTGRSWTDPPMTTSATISVASLRNRFGLKPGSWPTTTAGPSCFICSKDIRSSTGYGSASRNQGPFVLQTWPQN